MFCAALMPYFLEKPANPAGQPEVILPDWYLLWSYGMLKPGIADQVTLGGNPIDVPILGPLNAKTMGILLNIIITIPLVLLPFVSTGKNRRPQEAPWWAAFGVAGIVYVFNASVYSVNNVIFTKIGWWGDSLLKLTPVVGVAKANLAGAGVILGGLAFWVLPVPILAFVVRKWVLKESTKLAASIAAVELFLLVSIVAYGGGLDVLLFAQNPMKFLADSLANTNLLAWVVWMTTILGFEVSYWILVAWKQWAVRQEHYEYGLNLTYDKVR